MFTGIVLETGMVKSINKAAGITRLAVRTPTLHEDAVIGDSICINGACLTVIDITGEDLSFELSEETINTTNLGRLKKGERVNLEPAIKADGKIGGHFVTGHIDGIGTIRSKTKTGQTIEIDIEVPGKISDYLVDKGSVAVDGISLTVVKVLNDSFRLVVIPHTEKVTSIGDRKTGSTVNIETDIIGKYVKKFLSAKRDAGIMTKLIDSGFINRDS